ncbi:TetR/AcrR family transcriptional regulator [Paracoccus benzoatiresistens]|uniref:TetR/AcrR family transcriptional regulator n=1 Tax=Paracoccus benzoatiresistens TaxID=2997341 RepID=A0ABT4JDR3_9RHOB|nr:TetR/AcrR family transcriptional regulator [Paracoccus sp. EF6]MCZ0964508.1 TetR/AcrR family transcriptional regulator [Paracoccus sp. EF6]
MAEAIVSEQGAAALTIDAVAKAAGISKGGVQSCFGTKEAMISAMLDRWLQDYAAKFDQLLKAQGDDLAARIGAHVSLSLGGDSAGTERAAALVAALVQSPEQLEAVRAWYEERFAGLFAAKGSGRTLRVALLATEGAVFLRHFGLAALSEREWNTLHDDVAALLSKPSTD